MTNAGGFFVCSRGCTGECGQKFVHLPPVANFPSPANKWAEAVGDTWLREQVLVQWSLKDQWHDAVAAGLVLRLRNIPQIPAWGAVRDALSGKLHPVMEPAKWAVELSELQVETLNSFVSVETDAIHCHLVDLGIGLEYSNEGWLARLEEALVRRDNVQCAIAILHQGEGRLDEGTALCIKTLDEIGDAFVSGLPRHVVFASERLTRARKLGNTWWTRPIPEE